jgi:hypothetical protein
MGKYEFSFMVTEVELSPEQRLRVGRAAAPAGAAELGAAPIDPAAKTCPSSLCPEGAQLIVQPGAGR